MFHPHRIGLAASAALLLGAGLLAATPATAAVDQAAASPSWCSASADRLSPVDSWTAAPSHLGGPYTDKTVRNIIHPTLGGHAVRLRLSNSYGTVPVRFDSVWIGDQSTGAGVVAGTNQRVRFGGSDAITVPVGAEVFSDPVDMTVKQGKNLSVSIHVAGDTGEVTGHIDGQQDGWFSDGDTAADPSAASYVNPVEWWFWMDALTVQPDRPARTVVALGDSITDGYDSTPNANHRWPDYLATRLASCGRVGVANEGIAGNQVTADGAGVSTQARLDRDVLSQPNLSTVVYIEGINDIGSGRITSAAQLIQADEQIITRAHLAGVRVLGGTLTPFEGAGTYSAANEQIREDLNQWIRTSRAFDGVVDFDAAVRDPADPLRMLPSYDSGDHLHPGDTGYQAMAAAVPLTALH
jgi:lysophospholipase L1-like esterase